MMNALLHSISQSSVIPNKILIVSADKKNELKFLTHQLNIEIMYSEIANQAYQKQIGLKYIKNLYDYVVFLDDDIFVSINTFEEIENSFNNLDGNYLGVALNLIIEKPSYNIVEKIFKKIFTLNSSVVGKVLKNGHVSAYLGTNQAIDLEWSNGISAWKNISLCNYGFAKIPKGYSAYEDVIFSYKNSRIGKIRFLPDAKIYPQSISGVKRLNYNQFCYASYWRLFFVKSNKNLNILLLLYSQIGRNFEFIIKGDSRISPFQRSILSLKLFGKLILLSLNSTRLEAEIFLP